MISEFKELEELKQLSVTLVTKLKTNLRKLSQQLGISGSHLSSIFAGSVAPSEAVMNRLYHVTGLDSTERNQLMYALHRVYPNVKINLGYDSEDAYRRDLIAKFKLTLEHGSVDDLEALESTLTKITNIPTVLLLKSSTPPLK